MFFILAVTRPVARGRQLLLQIHAEYTSITDELESVCHMITSPTSSLRGKYGGHILL